MKAGFPFAIVYLIASGSCLAAPAANDPAPQRIRTQAPTPGLTVYLTPDSDPEAVISRDLDAAKHSILLQTGTLQSLAVVKSLLAARQRGVGVQIFLPQLDGQANSVRRRLQDNGFSPMPPNPLNLIPPSLNVRMPLFGAARDPIGVRGTVCIIDGATVLVGSYEFRRNEGVSVATNLIRIENTPGMARTYTAGFKRLAAHSYLAPVCQLYAGLSVEDQKKETQNYLARLTNILTDRPPFHPEEPLAPSPPPLDVFPKLPWPAGINLSKLNPRGVGVIWMVDEQGAAKDIRLSQSSGNSQIDALALDQVRRYHYPVSYESGKPAPFGHARMFRLDDLFTLPERT